MARAKIVLIPLLWFDDEDYRKPNETKTRDLNKPISATTRGMKAPTLQIDVDAGNDRYFNFIYIDIFFYF